MGSRRRHGIHLTPSKAWKGLLAFVALGLAGAAVQATTVAGAATPPATFPDCQGFGL
jgi:hypothetical protein